MKEALNKAGIDTDGAALYALAQKHVSRHLNPATACDGFVADVLAAGGLGAALWRRAPEGLHAESLKFLRIVADDMTGKPGKADGAVKPTVQLSSPAGDDRGGQSLGDAQWQVASPASPQQIGGGRSGNDALSRVAPAVSQDGGGRANAVARTVDAAPVREPSVVQKAAAKKGSKQLAASIWGESIGIPGVTLATVTRHHLVTLRRQTMAVGSVIDGFLTAFDWPDDMTPLSQIASADEVKRIWAGRHRILDQMGLTNV